MPKNLSFYEIARWGCVLLALILLTVMFGGNSPSSANAEHVAAAVTETIDMTNMLKAENQMVKRLYGLDPAAFESCILYYPTTNMMAEEVLIVKLSDMSQQDMVRAAAEKRLATQKTTFEGYGVEQFDLLSNHSIIEVRGNYVLFVVNENCDAALKAFRKAL
jgi:hypothetical protein